MAESSSYFRMFFVTGDVVGQAIIVLLVGLSLFVVGYAFRLMILCRRESMIPQPVWRQLAHLLTTGQYRQAIALSQRDDSYLGSLIYAGLMQAVHGYPAMERAMVETAEAQLVRMLRPVEHLNVIGAVAPMLGLLGTVYGMIVAFEQLVEAGGRPSPAELAAGISTALITTLWGLVVAIPALVSYALIRNRINAQAAEGLAVAETLIRPFQTASPSPAAEVGHVS